MKMKKILAVLASAAIACTAMAMTASAATTVNTDGEYTGDWSTPNFVVDDEGTVLNYLSYDYFTEFADTGCTLTVNFNYRLLAGEPYEYYMFGVCNANGWAKIFSEDSELAGTAGVAAEADARDDKKNPLMCADGTTPLYDYFTQADGYFILNPVNGEWVTTEVTFNLTADAIKFLQDNAATAEDGTTWGGLIFQTYGADITSIDIEEGLNAAPKANEVAGGDTEEPKDDDKTDDNTPTGSTAGLAFAGIALAGAAIVATKKIK